MAVRKGDASKEAVTNKLLEVFSDHNPVVYDKKIYINFVENGEPLQIAVSMAMPKVMVGSPDGDPTDSAAPIGTASVTRPAATPIELSEADREKLENLKKMLGI